MIDPQLHIWGTDVAIYLFLGGIAAGIMVLSGLYYLVRGGPERAPSFIKNGMIASPLLLSIGMFFLFLDLENPWNVWRFYTAFVPSSPMSWGSWILIVIYPLSIAMIVVANKEKGWVNIFPSLEKLLEPYWKGIALGNVLFGVALGLYTGVLLSAPTARPFWNNGLLAPLFLVSGISTGAAWMILFHDGSNIEEKEELGLIKTGLILCELAVIVLLISSMLTSISNQKEAIRIILGGPYTGLFWVFVVGIGVLLPLVLQSMENLHRIESRFVMPSMVLVGGFVLRYIIVNAGQMSNVLP